MLLTHWLISLLCPAAPLCN